MCVKISIFDSAFREKCLVFLRKASKPLASSLALTPSFHTGAFVIHAHSQTLGEHTVSSLYLRAFHLWVFVCSSFAHVLCAYTHVTVLGVYASPLSCCVPNWLWHICGFSRRIRAGAKLPRNQCNRLHSPPLPSSSSLLLLPESAPLFLSVSVRLCLCSRLSFFSFFFLLLCCSEPLLKMERVCAAYLKWSWMDLNGWWYLVSPQGAAMSP